MNTLEKVKQLLLEIAEALEKQVCQQCRGHNDHIVCDPPDVAKAIREVLKEV